METITRYPTLQYIDIPDDQRDAASLVKSNLDSLNQWVGNFAHALSLFDFCDEQLQSASVALRGSGHPAPQDMQRTFIGWQFLAARDGALTIFHFGKSMDAAHNLLHKCQAVKATVDLEAFKEARKTFREKFPRYEAIRHGVAHLGEILSSPEKRDEHSFSGKHQSPGFSVEGKNFSISDNLVNRTYNTLWVGEIWEYEISPDTLMVLRTVADQIYKSFDPQAGINCPL